MKTKIGLLSHALAALLFLGLPLASSSAYVAVSVGIAPPAIPVYGQPLCPAPGYIWAPGYWAYGDFGYYWVPGAWVLPPQVGFLWTPGYWGYAGSTYIFHEGYWGPSVGFYGGINYGYGYYGSGYYGGRWVGSTFHYNTAVSRVNTSVIHNTYVNREVVRNATGTRASFNGDGGVQAKPTAKEQAAAKARHVAPTSTQRSRVTAAKDDPALRATNNKGEPKVTAVETFESKHGPKVTETAATGGSDRATEKNGAAEQGSEKPAGADKQASPEKANARVADKPSDPHPSVKTASKKGVASSQTRKATDAQQDQPREVVSASRADHHAPTALHRPQAAAHPPQATRHQQAAENPKKKKKKKDKGNS